MLLTLIPPASYPIPESLTSHNFPPPLNTKTKFHSRVLAFSRVNKSLEQLGIRLPCFLAAERTNWLSLAIKEVSFNLDSETIEVYFIDGSTEKWDLEEPFRDEVVEGVNYPSQEFVADSSSSEEVRWEKSEVHQLEEEAKLSKERKGKGKLMESMLDQLLSISKELRSAFEDLGVAHPFSFDSEDYVKMIELSAKPTIPLPSAWNIDISSLTSTATDNSNSNSLLLNLSAQEEEEKQILRSAASLASPPASPEADASSDASSEDEDRTIPSRGQFTNRRRPTSLSAFSRFDNEIPTAPHDVLSFIHLLTTARQHLINLFSSSIIPVLKKRLPPTYSLWAASNGVKCLRSKALIRGAKVAKMILDLLDDDGETYDVSEAEEEDIDSDQETEDDQDVFDATLFWWESNGGKRKESEEEKRERRLKSNFLLEVFDDLSLRIWCEKALERGNAAVKLKKEGGSQPNWIGPVSSWDVSRTLSPNSFLRSKVKSRKSNRKNLSSNNPQTNANDLLSQILSNSSASKSKYNNSSGEDTDTEEESHPHFDSIIYFYPQNTMHEELLPPRLPKSLLGESELSLGKELSSMRNLIKTDFDTIAGLQKKMVELENFIELGYLDWEETLHENDVEKKSTSGMRIPGRPIKTVDKDGTLLSSAQPLRYYTADVTLASNLKDTSRKTSKIPTSPRSPKKSSTSLITPIIPSIVPRKRQRANLASLDSLLVNSTSGEKREPLEGVVGNKRKLSKGEKDKPATLKKKKRKAEQTSSIVVEPPIFKFPIESSIASVTSQGFTRVLHPAINLDQTQTQFTPIYSTPSSLQFPPSALTPNTSSPSVVSSQEVLRLSPQALSNQRKGFASQDAIMDWKYFDEKELDSRSGDLLVSPSEGIFHTSVISGDKLWQDTDSEWEEPEDVDLVELTRKFSATPPIEFINVISVDVNEAEAVDTDIVISAEDQIEAAQSIIRPSISFSKSFSTPIVERFESPPSISTSTTLIDYTAPDTKSSTPRNTFIISPTPIRQTSFPLPGQFELPIDPKSIESNSFIP